MHIIKFNLRRPYELMQCNVLLSLDIVLDNMFKAYERFGYTKFGANAAVVYVLYVHIFQQFLFLHCKRTALQ